MSTESKSATFALIYWLVVMVTLGAAIIMLFTYTPVALDMDGEPMPIQKLFYAHLPTAINAFLGCLLAFIGGIGFLWQRSMKWDALSAAGAKVAALMCTVVLITGMVWGRAAWWVWWTWSPRLTFSLLLWLLYVVYLIIRPSIDSPQTRATVCGVYAIAAFLDVPLVWLSARLMKDIHPKSPELMDPAMKLTLAAWFVPVTLLALGLVIAFYRRGRRRAEREFQPVVDAPWAPPETTPGNGTGNVADPPAADDT